MISLSANLDLLFQPRSPAAPGAAYKARALYGIWATAPYLHNGSVPNLWELLTPAKRRKATFMVGSRVFDPKERRLCNRSIALQERSLRD